jgi:hypothetical protein
MTYREIDDPRKYRISMSGFSIKTGWGDEKRIVAKYPGAASPLDKQRYEAWLEDAERICEQYNTALGMAKELE